MAYVENLFGFATRHGLGRFNATRFCRFINFLEKTYTLKRAADVNIDAKTIVRDSQFLAYWAHNFYENQEYDMAMNRRDAAVAVILMDETIMIALINAEGGWDKAFKRYLYNLRTKYGWNSKMLGYVKKQREMIINIKLKEFEDKWKSRMI